MPSKRYVRRTVEFLDRAEMDALLAAPDRSTWLGRRDHAMLTVALQTGLRVSELTNLRRCDVVTGTGAHITLRGQGTQAAVHALTTRECQDPGGLGLRNGLVTTKTRSSRPSKAENSVVTV